MEQGEGAGGVDDPCLVLVAVDGVQNLVEFFQLMAQLRVVGLGGVELDRKSVV